MRYNESNDRGEGNGIHRYGPCGGYMQSTCPKVSASKLDEEDDADLVKSRNRIIIQDTTHPVELQFKTIEKY